MFYKTLIGESIDLNNISISFAPSSVTSREKALWDLATTVTKAWDMVMVKFGAADLIPTGYEDAFHKFVGLHLIMLYGIEDVVVLNRMTADFMQNIKVGNTEKAS
mgnify:CR=1 FL=1